EDPRARIALLLSEPVMLLLHGFPTAGHMFRNPARPHPRLPHQSRAPSRISAILSREAVAFPCGMGQERSLLLLAGAEAYKRDLPKGECISLTPTTSRLRLTGTRLAG